MDPDLPMVLGDPDRLQQVLWNLLSNGIKFTPRGGRVTVTVARRDGDVLITVADTGAGIKPEFLPHVFERFRQAESSTNRAYGGLGLGLAIVRSLVALHGGTVEAHSDGEGKGATFTVVLPAVDGAAAAETPADAADPRPSVVRRILIVDDNQDAAELLAEAFELAGHTVRVAHDGERALEVAAEFDPECVMLDIGLPLLDGYEVARRLRKRTLDHQLTLVAMTGYGQADDVRRALDAGFDRHLVKPVQLDVSLEIIANSPGTAPS
jgi:CheY-like chemotaxis protein